MVPELVTGPNDRAIEPNGQVMKPSGALVSELTEKVEPPVGPRTENGHPPPGGAVVAQTVVNCQPPVEEFVSSEGGAPHSNLI